MLCPHCQRETKVIDSRDNGKEIWRRRECLKCQKRFTTYERIELPKLLVIKRDQRREAFSKEKIIRGIQKACAKRPIKITKIEEIADKIEKEIYDLGKPEIKSKSIGELVMKELEELDPVAYIRFASVYRPIRSIKSFEEEVHKVIKK